MKITTRMISDLEFEAKNETGNTLRMDSLPLDLKESLSPTQLILAGLAGCSAVDIVQILKKKRKTVIDLVIESDGTRREKNPHRFTDIVLHFILTSPDATSTDLEKAAVLVVEKYCSVSSSLREDINLKLEFTVRQS